MADIILNNVASKATADAHYANTSNPHSVTKSQVGLSNADNTSDANKPVSTAQQTALDLKQSISTLASNVLAIVLTGFVAGANTAIAATDTLAQALAKIQGQINARPNEDATSIAAINHGAAPKTTLVDADEITGQDSASSFSLIRTPWTNAKAFLKTYFDTLYGTADGWTPISATLTYSSAADPNYVISSNADLTNVLSVDMKIRFTNNATTFYGYIQSIGAWNGTAQLITVFGGTTYDVANSAITVPYYSTSSEPFGFPGTPTIWEGLTLDTTLRSQVPVAGTWYNEGGVNIVLPIGIWDVWFQVLVAQTSQVPDVWITLSTANNTESDNQFTVRSYIGNANYNIVGFQTQKTLTLAAPTTYYINSRTGSASVAALTNNNDVRTLMIRARRAKL